MQACIAISCVLIGAWHTLHRIVARMTHAWIHHKLAALMVFWSYKYKLEKFRGTHLAAVFGYLCRLWAVFWSHRMWDIWHPTVLVLKCFASTLLPNFLSGDTELTVAHPLSSIISPFLRLVSCCEISTRSATTLEVHQDIVECFLTLASWGVQG